MCIQYRGPGGTTFNLIVMGASSRRPPAIPATSIVCFKAGRAEQPSVLCQPNPIQKGASGCSFNFQLSFQLGEQNPQCAHNNFQIWLKVNQNEPSTRVAWFKLYFLDWHNNVIRRLRRTPDRSLRTNINLWIFEEKRLQLDQVRAIVAPRIQGLILFAKLLGKLKCSKK